MSDLIHFSSGGYAFLKGGFPYSQGVKALPGYAIERVRFAQPVPVATGFAAIEAHLSALGRTRTALCAAELRSPAPLSMSGFKNFNESYVEVLKRWNLFHDGLNPVARSNVAPQIAPPSEPCFLRLRLHRSRPRTPARVSSSPAAASGRKEESFPETSSHAATSPLRRSTRKRVSCLEKCKIVLPAWAPPGVRPPRFRCTRCTIFIRSFPGKFSPEPATARGLPGTTAGHRSRNSNLKWTSDRSRWNE